ncbi:SH3 domain-containing protein, partial [Galactobacter sp.]|uniref:SH3 domain-containing protein n=1 Tax=Galactobacter sp. TaxID=2676125 RepID=UPI0025BE8449
PTDATTEPSAEPTTESVTDPTTSATPTKAPRQSNEATGGAEKDQEDLNLVRYIRNPTPFMKEASSASVRLATIPQGTRVVITAKVGNWAQTTFEGRTGFLYAPTHLSSTPVQVPMDGIRYTKDKTPFRRSASSDDKVIANIPQGTKLKITGKLGNWAQTTYNGNMGFVYASKHLSAKPTLVPMDTTRYTRNTSPLRSGASGAHKVLVKVPVAAKLHVTGKLGGWVRTSYSGKTGYIYASTHITSKPPKITSRSGARYVKNSTPFMSGPAQLYKRVDTIPAGTKVTLTGKYGNWARVTYKGKSGYVYAPSHVVAENRNSIAVYGTLRAGHYVGHKMNGYTQRDLSTRLHKMDLLLWKKLSNPNNDATVVSPGSTNAIAEQYTYSASKGPKMLSMLDSYESYYKISGKRVYTKQLKSMTDGTRSWTFAANPSLDKIIRSQSRLVKSGDFDDRRRY